MKVLIYETLTAHGPGRSSDDPAFALYAEGKAMRDAIADDFRKLLDVEVVTFDGPSDDPLSDAIALLQSQTIDTVFPIAPETGGILAATVKAFRDCGVRVLVSQEAAIRATADKLETYFLWRRAGVPTPETVLFDPQSPPKPPFLLKPRDGAGTLATYLVEQDLPNLRGEFLYQPYVAGVPASLLFFVTESLTIPLLPGVQDIRIEKGELSYHGGFWPLADELQPRAVTLGLEAVSAISGLYGFVGVDMILGETDQAIEINPRVTTSYVALRQMTSTNLLSLFAEPNTRIEWRETPVRLQIQDGIQVESYH